MAYVKSQQTTISSAEVTAIENEISNATHEIACLLHSMQCDVVQRECYTPSARVEMILQLAAFSNSAVRAGMLRCDRIAGAR